MAKRYVCATRAETITRNRRIGGKKAAKTRARKATAGRGFNWPERPKAVTEWLLGHFTGKCARTARQRAWKRICRRHSVEEIVEMIKAADRAVLDDMETQAWLEAVARGLDKVHDGAGKSGRSTRIVDCYAPAPKRLCYVRRPTGELRCGPVRVRSGRK